MNLNRKRILILNRCYPPEVGATGQVSRDLAKFLARNYQITVLTGRPSDGPEKHPYYLFRRYQEGEVTVERVGSTAFTRRRMVGRLADYLSYLILAFVRAMTIRPKPDVVVAMTDPPLVSLIGAVVAWMRGSKLVYNIQDLHPDMAVAAGLVRSGLFVSLWEWLHHWSLHLADKIVVLGEDMRKRVVDKGIQEEKIVTVRDGVPLPYQLPSLNHPLVRSLRCGFSFVVMHAGNIGFYGAWETLLQAIGQLKVNGVGLVFVGDGTRKTHLQNLAGGLPNVRFLPFRPSDEVLFVLAAADIHIVTIQHRLEGLVVPSKLYPILAAGKPVLVVASKQSDAARVAQRGQCGLVADPNNPSSVAEALTWAYHHPRELNEMGQRARIVAQEFTQEKQFKKFTEVIEQLIR